VAFATSDGLTLDCTRLIPRAFGTGIDRDTGRRATPRLAASEANHYRIIPCSLFVLKLGACGWLGRSPFPFTPTTWRGSWPSLDDCRDLDDLQFISDTKRDTNATCSIHVQLKSLKFIASLASECRHHNPCVGGSSPSTAANAQKRRLAYSSPAN
jgi:hypothetical protein